MWGRRAGCEVGAAAGEERGWQEVKGEGGALWGGRVVLCPTQSSGLAAQQGPWSVSSALR